MDMDDLAEIDKRSSPPRIPAPDVTTAACKGEREERLKERQPIIQKEGCPTYTANKIPMPPISPVPPPYQGIYGCGRKKVYMFPDTRQRYLAEIRLKESHEYANKKRQELPRVPRSPFTPPPMEGRFGRNQHLFHLPSGITRYGTVQPNLELILLDNRREVWGMTKESDAIDATVAIPTPTTTEGDSPPIPKIVLVRVKRNSYKIRLSEESLMENQEVSPKKPVSVSESPTFQKNSQILNSEVNEEVLTPSPKQRKNSSKKKETEYQQNQKSSEKRAPKSEPRAKKRKRSSENKNEMVEETDYKSRPTTSPNYSELFNKSGSSEDASLENSVKIPMSVDAEMPDVSVPELEDAKDETLSIWPPRTPNLSDESTEENSDVSDLALAAEAGTQVEVQVTATIAEKCEGLPSMPEFRTVEEKLLVPELSYRISKKIDSPGEINNNDNSEDFSGYTTANSSFSSSYSDASTHSSPTTPRYSPIDWDISIDTLGFNDATTETSPDNVEVDIQALIPRPIGTKIDIDGSSLTGISETLDSVVKSPLHNLSMFRKTASPRKSSRLANLANTSASKKTSPTIKKTKRSPGIQIQERHSSSGSNSAEVEVIKIKIEPIPKLMNVVPPVGHGRPRRRSGR